MTPDLTLNTPGKKIPVTIRDPYPADLLAELFRQRGFERFFLMIDENVEREHGAAFRDALMKEGLAWDTYVIPSGEKSKSADSWLEMLGFLFRNRVRRNTPVVAAGGGVTGDAAGFAAATAMRGLPLIHIPTTLLAMVDSSVGGKTGINHELGKNLIGSFYQPEAIFASTRFLSTLPKREWANGLSEILKYGAIQDQAIFKTAKKLFLNRPLPPDMDELKPLITRCIEIKAEIVEQDEKESGIRAWLNFGHTFAHALENAAGYQSVSHGEAVILGMIAASRLSSDLGGDLPDEARFTSFLPLYNLDPEVTTLDPTRLIDLMQLDKKKVSSRLRLTLLHKWGKPYVEEIDDHTLIRKAWESAFLALRNDQN
ncbi:MAG: 3-dehydroquinate synthase [Balneolaceae bacterium]